MAEDNQPEDYHSSTPLDLLLNAISGSGDYHYPTQDEQAIEDHDGENDEPQFSLRGLLAASRAGAVKSGKRDYGSDDEETASRQARIARTLTSHLISSSQAGPSSYGNGIRWNADTSPAFSTVEVWYPRTGQKSYGKERRMLHPPPMLRVTGPLFPVLTNATLFSILPPDISPLTQRPMSTQTHVIPLAEPLLTTSQRPGRQRNLEREEAKRQLREAAAKSGFGASLPHERRRPLAREREVLGEGLAFSGLWVGEEVGKAKEFRLQLSLGRPGVEEEQEVGQTQTPGPEEVARMLDPEIQEQASIDGLPDLEGEITPHDETTLLEHLNTSADLAPLDSTPMAILPEIKPAFQPWATFLSEPLTVVSKPSQKTAKARSLASCLSQRDSVALWVRINGQTVRTKYMKLEPFGTPQLTAKTGKWTPFRFDVIHRAVPPPTQAKPVKISSKVNGEDEVAEVLTYGSLVVLVDLQSGVRSEAVKLVRVERNEAVVGADEGHPVSELQRVGFVREEPDHQEAMGRGRWYLSAPGARLGGGELLDPSAKGRNASRRSAKLTAVVADTEESRAPETLGGVEKDSHPAASGSVTQVRPAKKRKTSRNALAMATLAEDEDHSSASLLSWKQAEREEREIVTDDGKVTLTQNVVVEMVEDFMCWVIGGVSSFSYSFFDSMADSGALPTSPIDPIPRILADPVFHADTNTLDLVISDLHTPDPLEVYLGPIGPLGVSTWQSTAPAGNSVSSSEYPATPLDDVAKTGERVMSAFPSSVQHVIVLVEMPNPEQIIRTMQECVAAEGPSNSEQADSRDDAAIQESTPWLRGTEEHKLEVEELTIQEALRNAENGSTDGYCLTSLPLDGGNDIIIDPTLQMEDEQRQRVQLEVDGKPATQSHSKDRHPPLIALTRRRVRESCHEMVPLPLLLVRRSDGVGFGTGRSVAAERLGVGKVSRSGSARWGLRVIES